MKKVIFLKVKAVIFDMDGVITNTMPYHFRAWQQVLKEEGIAATHHDIYRREGQRGIDSVQEIFAHYQVPFHRDQAERILLKKEILFKKIVKNRYIPGSRLLIQQLLRQGFRLALVTGTARDEVRRILPNDLFQHFSVVVSGTDVRQGKPSPVPYLKALDQLGLRAKDAVVIENAPFGILSAKSAGLRCLAIATSLPPRFLKQADQIFGSIKELKSRVQFQLPE